MLASIGTLLLVALNYLVLVYFALLNTFYLGTSIFAFGALRRYARRLNSLDVEELLRTAGAPPVTLLLPAFDEEAGCVESVRSLLQLEYVEYEIIVINDGSQDRTLDRLRQAFDMTPAVRAQTADLQMTEVRGLYQSRSHPRLWVIDKENGGKSDALNAGLNFCQTPLFCAMDADGVIERDAMMRLVRPFLEDSSTIAAGGIVRIVNGSRVQSGQVSNIRLPRSLLARFQVVEYLRAFLSGRMGWGDLGILLIISGAFGVFRRSLVVEVGGFATDTVGEDMELVVRLHRHCREKKIPYRVTFVPDPVAWTEAPESLRSLARQRDRWQRGLMQSLTRHRTMLFNRRYGRIGMLAFPYFYFLEGLGPIVEILGYVSFAVALPLGLVSVPMMLAFLVLAFFCGAMLSAAAVALEERVFRRYTSNSDFVQLFGLAILENFGYRQLLSLWRAKGVLTSGRRAQVWGRQERRGFYPGTAGAEAEAEPTHSGPQLKGEIVVSASR